MKENAISRIKTFSSKISTLFMLVFLVGLLGACTWVKKEPEAIDIRVVPVDRVADCVSLGTVKTTTVDNISIVNRNAAKVEKELETIAQNEAADSGADTIVATTKVVNGHRTYAMFKCLR